MQIPDDFLSSFLPNINELWFSIDFNSPDATVQKMIQKMRDLLLIMHDLHKKSDAGYLLSFHTYLFDFFDLLYPNFLR